jgi:hypothetical protein
MSYRVREANKPKQGVNPIWRGVGCVMFVFLTVGMYWTADVSIKAMNAAHREKPFLPAPLNAGIPQQHVTLFSYTFPRGPVREIAGIPLNPPLSQLNLGFDMINAAFALLGAIVVYSLSVLVWAVLNPPKLGPRDAPPVHRKIDRNKVR